MLRPLEVAARGDDAPDERALPVHARAMPHTSLSHLIGPRFPETASSTFQELRISLGACSFMPVPFQEAGLIPDPADYPALSLRFIFEHCARVEQNVVRMQPKGACP